MAKEQLAFPVPVAMAPNGALRTSPTQGMTLRDYFAAAALPAIVAKYQGVVDDVTFGETPLASFAEKAYAWADAMIAARGGAEAS